jgi:hypothetical protein
MRQGKVLFCCTEPSPIAHILARLYEGLNVARVLSQSKDLYTVICDNREQEGSKGNVLFASLIGN